MPLRRVVTIDGPSGAGKSTLAQRLAEVLGWRLLDTGAMYRAVAFAALRSGVPLDQDQAVDALASTLCVELPPGRVLLGGVDVTSLIRTPEVSQASSKVAAYPLVRRRLVEWQRAFAAEHDTVTEGRDQGTVVFPEADRKFFLVASQDARAARRNAELRARGEDIELARTLIDQMERDARDAGRATSPMKPADDAIVIDSTDVPLDEVVALVLALVRDQGRPPWQTISDSRGDVSAWDGVSPRGWHFARVGRSALIVAACTGEQAERTARALAGTEAREAVP